MEETGRKPKEVFARLHGIYEKIVALQKTGTNQEQHYKFIEQAVIASHIRDLFFKAKLVLLTDVEKFELSEVIAKSGAKLTRAVVWMRFTVCCAEDPDDKHVWENWPGESIDSSDKALNKAGTAAQKYWMIRQFLISDVDPDFITPIPGDQTGRQKRVTNRDDTVDRTDKRPLDSSWRKFKVIIPGSKAFKKPGKLLGDLQDSQLAELNTWLAAQPADQYREIRANVAMAIGEKNMDVEKSPIEQLKAEMEKRRITEPEFLATATTKGWVHDSCESIMSVRPEDADKILSNLEKFLDEVDETGWKPVKA